MRNLMLMTIVSFFLAAGACAHATTPAAQAPSPGEDSDCETIDLETGEALVACQLYSEARRERELMLEEGYDCTRIRFHPELRKWGFDVAIPDDSGDPAADRHKRASSDVVTGAASAVLPGLGPSESRG